MRLALVLAAALPLAASCGVMPGASGRDAPTADALSVRTDLLRVAVDSLQYTVAVGYPQLVGASATVPAARVAAVNAAIRDSVVAFAESLRPARAVTPDERTMPGFVVELAGGPHEMRLRGDVLSGLVAVSLYFGGARGAMTYLPVSYDLHTGTPVALTDVFRPGTPWADSLSAHAGRAFVARLRANGMDGGNANVLYPEGYDAAAMPSATFTLGADSLAVHFAPDEVAYHASGTTRVAVAYASLDAFLHPDGPVARLRQRPSTP